MPVRIIDLAKRLFRRSAPSGRARLAVEALEDRTALSTVTVAKIADAVEGGAGGVFRFTRTGETGQELTVDYAFAAARGGMAASGVDYIALPGTVTFAVGSSTVDVPVTARPDNEFEGDEVVEITLVAPLSSDPLYTLGGETTQVVTITDDPPRVTAAVVWEQVGTEVGRVTLTRSGGDLNQPLTVWFEVEGTVEVEGETVTVVMGAAAELQPGEAIRAVPIIVDPNNGGFANVQMPGATQPPPRTDGSQALQALLPRLEPSHPQFGATILETLPQALDNLPSPITYQELLVLRAIRNRLQSLDASVFDSPTDRTKLLATLAARIDGGIAWETPPQILAVQAIVNQIFAGLITAARDRAAIVQAVDALAAQLNAPDQLVRDEAEAELISMIGRYLFVGDFSRATIVVSRMRYIAATSDDQEIRDRAKRVLIAANKVVRYLQAKQDEYLRITGGTP